MRVPLGALRLSKRFRGKYKGDLDQDLIWIDYRGNDLLIDPNDLIGMKLYLTGKWENNVSEALENNLSKGDNVIDVGGHYGTHAVLMRKLVGEEGKVIVFEPNPFNKKLIENTISRNGFENVEVVNSAVSDEEGEKVLYEVPDNTGHSTMRPLESMDYGKEYSIDVETLDSFIENTEKVPDLIKMDIEGEEVGAIKGLERNLDKIKKIIMEVHNRNMSEKELEYLFNTLNSNGELLDLNNSSHKIKKAKDMRGMVVFSAKN